LTLRSRRGFALRWLPADLNWRLDQWQDHESKARITWLDADDELVQYHAKFPGLTDFRWKRD
jgi:hypothetical protein